MAQNVYGQTVGGLLYDAVDPLRRFITQNPLESAAIATAPIPVVGDVTGLISDAAMFATDPESRTLGNAALAALGILPFIPAASVVKALSPAEEMAKKVIDLLKSGKADEVTEEMLEKADPAYLAKNYDLPMDTESRMARAREMGFDVDRPMYHGTADNFPAFDKASRGKSATSQSAMRATWMADDPDVALGYARLAEEGPVKDLIKQSQDAELDGNFDLAEDLMRQAEALEFSDEAARGGNILKVFAPDDLKRFDADGAQYDGGDYILMDMVKQAQNEKAKGLSIDNFIDNVNYADMTEARHVGVFDPKNIRSVFARFDPRLQNLRNLNAGVAVPVLGSGVLAGLLAEERTRRDEELVPIF